MESISLSVAGYVRLSFDEDKENYESIINQISIIKAYAKETFGIEDIKIYEDDNFSGYKFNRPAFLKMKKNVENKEIDVIIAKDLSRLGRHNARTLLFLEEMVEQDVRVIAINDNMDTDNKNYDEVLGVKTWINEHAVKESSKKVRKVIEHKQKNGTWICAIPYGYEMIDYKKQIFKVDQVAAEVVKRIFELYINGWGYKKIANFLTDENIPTARMREKELKEAKGETYKKIIKDVWSIVSISGILKNDFYIGTLRTGKYTRKSINGIDVKLDVEKHNVFENNHEAIIDKNTFLLAQEQATKRTNNHYRGIKKYDNIYSGLIFCGDCGSPMFSISSEKRPNAYTCGTYHRRGLKGCTSHHMKEITLNTLLKEYVKRVKENSTSIINEINNNIQSTSKKGMNETDIIPVLTRELEQTKNELKTLKMQKIKEILRQPENEAIMNEIYAEMENEATNKILGLQNQISHLENNKQQTKKLKEVGLDALKIFDEVLKKERLTKRDLEFIVEKIVVYESNILIKLKGDIETIFNISSRLEVAATMDNSLITIKQEIPKHATKAFATNVINEGDPLEIYVDREGEVILKKYSPVGELGDFAKGYAESLFEAIGHVILIADRDNVVAVAGASKKEFLTKPIGQAVEKVMEERKTVLIPNPGEYKHCKGCAAQCEDDETCKFTAEVISPIIVEGDAIGAVIICSREPGVQMAEMEIKLAETAAGFLAKQMAQ